MRFFLLSVLGVLFSPAIGQTNGPDSLLSKPALSREHLGLVDAAAMTLTTGRCGRCRTDKQALWYFQNDGIAVPSGDLESAQNSRTADAPFLVWIGAPEIIETAHLTDDRRRLRLLSGESVPLDLVPRLSTNRSYFNEASAEFFAQRPLRLRGRTIQTEGQQHFVARALWPLDYRLDRAAAQLPSRQNSLAIPSLIESEGSTQAAPYRTHLLWERPDLAAASWAGKPLLGLMLNGAQGDDDEAHGGHFGLVTGRIGPQGEWADALMHNFYDLNVVSEKGIIPAMLPVDHYLMDLNSGQSYYRPSAFLALILKQDRIPAAFDHAVQDTYRRLYRHEIEYDHSTLNCSGLSLDLLHTIGWYVPPRGPSSRLKAAGAFLYGSATERSFASGRKLFKYFSEERTRLLPRVTFEAIAADVLALVGVQGSGALRPLTETERWLQDDLEAIVFVHLPQVPSSRAFGTYPVVSLDEYQRRVPADRSQWKTVPVAARPFPEEWRIMQPPERTRPATVWVVSGAAGLVLGLIWIRRVFRRRT